MRIGGKKGREKGINVIFLNTYSDPNGMCIYLNYINLFFGFLIDRRHDRRTHEKTCELFKMWTIESLMEQGFNTF